MQHLVEDLLDHLELERLERFLFRGESRDIGSPRVFGGQVLAQALGAAARTVKNRPVHSLHAYFLRAGDIKHPIIYEVDQARDGMSFSMRRVTAIQHGHQIFNLSASFQKTEEGLEHQFDAPKVKPPEDLPSSVDFIAELGDKLSPSIRDFYEKQRPFDFRFGHEFDDESDCSSMSPRTYLWFRVAGKLPDDPQLQRKLLAYVSDYHLIRTATLPHAVQFGDGSLQVASLDHAMWFNRDVRVDNWLLYVMDSPSSRGSRGLARGTIYDRQGNLIASTAQEGLVRIGNS